MGNWNAVFGMLNFSLSPSQWTGEGGEGDRGRHWLLWEGMGSLVVIHPQLQLPRTRNQGEREGLGKWKRLEGERMMEGEQGDHDTLGRVQRSLVGSELYCIADFLVLVPFLYRPSLVP